MAKLSKKELSFINEYFTNGFNGTKAYRKVFKSCKTDKTARTLASRLLTKDGVKEEIEKRQKELKEKSDIKREDILNDLRIIKDVNICDYMKIVKKERLVPRIDEETGDSILVPEEYDVLVYKATDELTVEQQKAIKSIEMTKTGIKYTFYDKDKAIDTINKMLGFYDNQIILNKTINTDFLKDKSTEELLKMLEEE
jgi:phage terminase small subunit